MGWLSKILGTDDRNRQLAEWGQSIPVSSAQSRAIRTLWLAAKAGHPPQVDPLAELSEDDRTYIVKIASADFRPPAFGSADIPRLVLFKSLLAKGFRGEHAAVVVGMTFNMVGPTEF